MPNARHGAIRRGVRVAKDAALLARDAGARWAQDACYRLGSSLAFAALFSIFPLLLLAITAVGFVLGDDAVVRERILASLANATSPAFRALLDGTLKSMQTHHTARGVGAVVGFVTLVLGASGVFAELQTSLNFIWRVQSPPSTGIRSAVVGAIKAKAFSFAVVVCAALAILVLLVASTALAALGGAAGNLAGEKTLWELVEIGISIATLTLLIALVYRLVPQTHVGWRDVFPAALLTAVLFTLVKNLLAWYLGHLGSYAAYGAVGAVLGLLTWIYVASMLVFYGAEFSRIYAERFGTLAESRPGEQESRQPET